MRKTITLLAALLALSVLGPAALAGHDENPSDPVRSYHYTLDAVGANSEGSGWTRLTALPNGKIQVKVFVEGLVPGTVHAQHLHGVVGEDGFVPGSCPTALDDVDANGIVDTLEGAPAYGGVQASLTTFGDTSTASALAIDRFPTADADGVLEYARTFRPTSHDLWVGLGALEVVVHGIDVNGNGIYDFDAGTSPLNAALPLEATAPAVCGGPGA